MTGRGAVAHLHIRLRGFTEPDTGSQVEGALEAGRYIVKEYRQNYPDADTDYALVLAPILGADDTWICTRWKDQDYADVVETEQDPVNRLSFDEDPAAIDEQTVVALLQSFRSFIYEPDDARYPFQLRGFHAPQSPPEQNNCCTFVEALLVRAWADTYPEFEWSPSRHSQMMILSNDDFFSPVTAAVEARMAKGVPSPDIAPHPWMLIQGWRRQWRDGHTFLIVDHHAATDRVLTLESNCAYGLNGVGFRSIGNLRDCGGMPPQNWWEQDGVWTWERIRATYRYRQQAWLRIKNRSWSGL